MFNGIAKSTSERFDQQTLKLVFSSLAADPQLFESHQISLNGEKAYIVTLHGLQVLYELEDTSIHIAYIRLAQL